MLAVHLHLSSMYDYYYSCYSMNCTIDIIVKLA